MPDLDVRGNRSIGNLCEKQGTNLPTKMRILSIRDSTRIAKDMEPRKMTEMNKEYMFLRKKYTKRMETHQECNKERRTASSR